MIKRNFIVSNMSCAACVVNIQKTLLKLKGVSEAKVILAQKRASVLFDENALNESDIIKALDKIGYSASLKTENKVDLADLKRQKLSLLICCLCFILVLFLSMGHMIKLPAIESAIYNALGQLVLTLISIYLCKKIFISAFKALLSLKSNMDTLVSFGVLCSLSYSLYSITTLDAADTLGVLHHSKAVFFEGATGILAFVSVGKYLENKIKQKTSSAIDDLYKLAPNEVYVKDGNDLKKISLNDLSVGQILCVQKGQTIGADGVVINGSAFVDESYLSGEPLAVAKQAGNKVYSSTLVNSGYLEIEVQKVGESSYLGSIIAAVENTLENKLPIQRITDELASIFVPIVITLALITYVYWYSFAKIDAFEALKFAISVVVISCPCALGLATPIAICAGVSTSAKLGIIFKSPSAIESLSKATTFAFDKTNTLTTAKMELVDFKIYDDTYKKDKLLALIKALEQRSSHPLALALVENITQKVSFEVENYKDYKLQGVSGVIDGTEYIFGNSKIAGDLNIAFSSEQQSLIDKAQSTGSYALCLYQGGKVLAQLVLSTKLKAQAHSLIASLKALSKQIVLITGDSLEATKVLKDELKIDKVYARVLPTEKSKIIKDLQNDGQFVVMCGDGVNDTVAMSQANLSISVQGSCDIAIKNTDVVLLKDDIFAIFNALKISKATLLNIKQNLFFALIYNLLMIPIASGVFYQSYHLSLNPILCSLLMGLSSLCVVLNAFRLTFYKEQKYTDIVDIRKDKTSIEINNQDNLLQSDKKTMFTYKISIEGMHCSHCANAVTKALSKLDNLEKVEVDLENKCAKVQAQDKLDESKIKEIIENLDFEFKGMSVID